MYATVLEMNEMALAYFTSRDESYLKMLDDKENYLILLKKSSPASPAVWLVKSVGSVLCKYLC